MSKALDTMLAIEFKVDLTPMIDMTFLLLIFFMVTSKFKSSEGSIQAFLPKDRGIGTAAKSTAVTETRVKLLWVDINSGSPTAEKHGRCVLKVGKQVFGDVFYQEDVCYFTGCGINHGSPDFEELRGFLAKAKSEYRPPKGSDESKGMPVIIDARTQVPFTYVVRALNSCMQAGIQDVTFAAAENPYE